MRSRTVSVVAAIIIGLCALACASVRASIINESQYAPFDTETVAGRSREFWCVDRDCYPQETDCETARRDRIDNGSEAPPACTRATEVWCFSTTNAIRRTSIGLCTRQTEPIVTAYEHCVSVRRTIIDANRYVTRWRNISQCVRVLGGAP
jgi:hypothetical protein